jgi:photosystem II stability/assembly factor-like uncharacterized protein
VPVRRWVRLPVGEGILTAVASNAANADEVYAGANSGALYLSRDGGRTWSPSGPEGLRHPVSVISLPSGEGPALLGTRGSGAFRRVGADGEWEPVTGLSGTTVHFILRDARPAAALFAGTDAGAFRSDDGGATWSPLAIRVTPPDVQAMAQDPADPLLLFAGTKTGVQKSTDGGVTWTPTGTGLDAGNVISLAVDPADPDTLWAGTETGSLYKANERGRFWRKAGAGISGTRVPALVSDQEGKAVYCGTGAGVFKSDDSLTWDPVGVDLTNKNITGLSFASGPQPRLYVSTYGGGLFRLTLG